MNIQKKIEAAVLEHLETRALPPKFLILTPYSYSELLVEEGPDDMLDDLNSYEVMGIRKKMSLVVAVTTNPNAPDISVV